MSEPDLTKLPYSGDMDKRGERWRGGIEESASKAFAGKDWHGLDSFEQLCVRRLEEAGLVEVRDGFVRRK